jgi:hypothetical protein
MQNKPNFQKSQMNVKLYFIEDYRKNDDLLVRINKPNFFKCQNERKLNVNKGLQKKRLFSTPKNKPNSNPIKACPQRSEFTLSAIEGNGQILKGMNLTFVPHGIMTANPHSQRIIQMLKSTLPSVLRRESPRQKDKIALKIYPFGIDYPIVLKEILRKMRKNVILSGASAQRRISCCA